mgnify:CR=1 FL=1|tara:strand:+ start:1665 stop:2660 length:996 start_codon:yes stop_codon:yes gene_type:complete
MAQGTWREDAKEQSELNRWHGRPADRQSGLSIRFNTPKEAEIQSKQVLDLTIDAIKSQLPDINNPAEIGQAVLEFALDKNPYTAIGRRMVRQGLKTISTKLPQPKPRSKRVLLTEAQKRANRRANTANRRFREALPSDDDLLSEFRSQGIPEELIPVYKKNARSGWARTKKAASLQPVETHAGHQRNLLSSGDPLKQKVNKLDTTATTGRTAKLEYGPDNKKKGARYGSMNQHVSDITGMPSNWRKDIKQWHQHYQGEPSLHYDSDWTVEQMDMLEAIPENWSRSKVIGRIEEIKQHTPTTAGQQYRSIQKELSEEALRESDLLENHYSAD